MPDEISSVTVGRRLYRIERLLEHGLLLVVAGSVLAFGSVHAFAYLPLWGCAAALGAVLAYRAVLMRALRRTWGARRIGMDFQGQRVVVVDPEPSGSSWPLDLAPAAPDLLWPWLAFLAWAAVALVPLPPSLLSLLSPGRGRFQGGPGWTPLAVSPEEVARGLAFSTCMLLLYLTAATALAHRSARERFSRNVSWLGFALSLQALAQFTSGTTRIYGWFEPREGNGTNIFGPFVNRNHFAGYMLLVVPLAIGRLAGGWARFLHSLGSRPSLRRGLLALSNDAGVTLLYAVVPAMATAAALVASTSRAALLAFLVSLLAVAIVRRRQRGLLLAAALAISSLGLWLSGAEKIEARFRDAGRDRAARTVVWKDSLERMSGLWLAGCGLDGFAECMSRVRPWALPRGATPWPDSLWALEHRDARVGFRILVDAPEQTWYREAHNDYLQVLVETGVPGLALALVAAGMLLRAARHDRWLLWAILGLLVHEVLDFDLQIPAIAVLFVSLAGAAFGRAQQHEREGTSRPSP